MHMKGTGYPVNLQKAAKSCQVAADAGHRAAQYALGMIFNASGEYEHVEHWWTTAAAAGCMESSFGLGKVRHRSCGATRRALHLLLNHRYFRYLPSIH
jgi:TPR repeat protein